MALKVALSAALLALATAHPVADSPAPAPYGPPAPYHAPAPYHEDPILPPVYNYEYGVNDANYGPVFSHTENRDNYDTAGEYRVNLPDGRVQIVSYKADTNGFIADVRYEGEASYPEEKEYKPAYHPAPAPYKPAPEPAPYKPAPAPYKPAPAPYHPAPAPYHPAPAPYHPAPVYHSAPAYKPRTYSFKPVVEAAAEEPAAPAAEEPAAPVEEEAAAPVEEEAAVADA